MRQNRLKWWAITFITAIIISVIVAMSVVSLVGEVEAGIDVAVVTIGISGIISALKSDMGNKNDPN